MFSTSLCCTLANLAHLENGKLDRTVCLHKILLSNVENAREISEMFEVAFGEQWEKHIFVWFSQSEMKLHMLKILNTRGPGVA